MITSSALASDVSLPPVEAANSDAMPAPVSGDARPDQSFDKLMNDTLGDKGQSSAMSTASPSKPTKDDKKDKDKGSQNAAVSAAVPTIIMTPPIPSASAPTAAKSSTTDGSGSPGTGVPNVKNDGKAVAVPAAPIPGDSRTASIPVSKPVNKDGIETKSSLPMDNKLTSSVDSKSSSDMPNDDSASHREQQPQQPNPLLSAVSAPPPALGGTETAKQVATMKMQEKTEGNTRTAEKNLPHGSFLPDGTRSDATSASTHTSVIPEVHTTPSSVTSNTPISPVASVFDKNGAAEASPRIETVRSPQVDRALTEISESAVSFKRIGTESVDVNLQPDRGTEISLHLTLNNGQVEMAARLERGNFDSLNTHWSDLQESLAQQGIRVGQLEHASLNQNPENNQNRNQAAFSQTMQQESGGPRQRPSGRATEVVDKPVRTGVSATPQRARTSPATNPVPRGWEMWA